ncbi:MAG: hypothetical protein U1F67_11905 [Rubrivivax sp.]
MKAGIVAYTMAMAALKRLGVEPARGVTLPKRDRGRVHRQRRAGLPARRPRPTRRSSPSRSTAG